MKVPEFIAVAAVAVVIALQGWTLKEVVSLREKVTLLEFKVANIKTR